MGMGEDVREEPEVDASSSSTRIDSRRPFRVLGRGLLGLLRVRVAGERRKDVGSTNQASVDLLHKTQCEVCLRAEREGVAVVKGPKAFMAGDV